MYQIERNSDTNVVVLYQMRLHKTNITAAEYSLLRKLTNEKVAAIKFVKEQYDLSLYDAKQIVDTVQNEQPV